ncbi:uncharacterized protein At3g60930, chloroplastic-like [Arabidopsis lyrata subsp. lyrata]|uniref:uncharacterized protein At3g60930, chloroplastic-like n=1 Tax=Arabidopsis lyrata subsp. lyrata TaxID=81972 RepID=UPI000A29A3C2|nr:uncharacterized protein At3g60930, chloroplastic-like [Arabidopsis lyrata subsp. lyrata]|eukprot:XP_020874491.1 uncharacterized protein At3g60930, chloroplastic-like [Arabidopsis lyrata subsp. lyrata]
MQGAAQSLRARKAAEKKAAKEKAVLEANFRPPTPPEAGLEVVGVEATNEARDMVSIMPEAAGRVSPPTGIPEVAGTSAIVALGAEVKTKAKVKRPRGDSSGSRRKEKRSRNEAPIYKDKMASANLIASCSGPTLAAPEALLEAENYRETAAGFLKAFHSMNRMVRAYDSSNRRYETSRAEAEVRIAGADAKMVEAEAKIAEAATKVAEADEARREAEALAKAEKVERLKVAEDGLRLRRKMEAEIERVKRLFTEGESLREKEARANAELIADLEGGKNVEDEKEEVLQWKAEYGDAEEEFVRIGTELREDLRLPPASPDSVEDNFGNRSIEGVAAGIGITDQAGTNLSSEVAHVPEGRDE